MDADDPRPSRKAVRPPLRRGVAVLIALGLAGCASPGRAHAPTTSVTAWASPLDRGHPLVGRIYAPRGARWVTEAEVTTRVAGARWVFLGERHDNADHHALQARLLAARARAGGAPAVTARPVLVAEMLDRDAQDQLDAARSAAPEDPDTIARASDWAHSGWPAWSLYRPIFAEAARAGLRVVGAGLSRRAARTVAMKGTSALDPTLVQRFGLDAALPPADQARLRDEMNEAHCGLLPESMFDAMILVQRARDALLADAALASPGGAVVIAGSGHARDDSGAPAALRRAAPAAGPRPLTVAFVEVTPERARPEDYTGIFGATTLPFDYVWFTPRANDEDHCAELREHQREAPPRADAPPAQSTLLLGSGARPNRS